MYDRSIRLIIESKIDEITLLANATRAICQTVVKDETLLYDLVLCLVEAVTNVIKHTYHMKPGNFIDVKVNVNDHEIQFEISDTGEKAELPPPPENLIYDDKDITTLSESGMGLFLIHHLMEEVVLARHEEKNVLSMRKQLGKQKCL